MLPRYVILLFILHFTINVKTKKFSCPQYNPNIPGIDGTVYSIRRYDDKDICSTFYRINWEEYNQPENRKRLLPNFINNVVCKKFKNGRIDSTWDLDEFLKKLKDLSRQFRSDNLLLGFFLDEFRMDESPSLHATYYKWKYDFAQYVYAEDGSIKHSKFQSHLTTDNVGKILYKKELHMFKHMAWKTVDEMRSCFKDNTSATNVVCPNVRMYYNQIEYPCWEQCQTLIKEQADVVVACVHDAYLDCDEEIVMECHFYTNQGKWYDRYLNVSVRSEEPYGKPCSGRTYTEIGAKECHQNCNGSWGEWYGLPTPECGTYTLHRYRPYAGGSPCFKWSERCCIERTTHVSKYSCEDFAYNTTINLKIAGCANSRPLIKGPTKHLMCDCGTDYKGIRCELDMCDNSCANGATCLTHNKKGICACRPGFTGENCTEKTEICGFPNECENGGKCIAESETRGAYCKCPPGFAGLRCEHMAEFCKDNTCNYQGVCYNLTEILWFKCRCDEGFTGMRCEEKSNSPVVTVVVTETSRVNTIISVAVLVVAALMLYVTYTNAIKYKRRRRLHASKQTKCAGGYRGNFVSKMTSMVNFSGGTARTIK